MPISINRFPASPASRAARVLLALVLAVLALGFSPLRADAAATGTLSVSPGAEARASIGRVRTTAIASATFTVPDTGQMSVGLQFRAAKKTSGYLAKLTTGQDGALTASFSRLKAGVQSAIGSPLDLGFAAVAGDKVHLEATVAAKRVVKLYLRAWKGGAEKPATWQLAATDSSSSRVTRKGHTYLWALGAADATGPNQLAYEAASASAYSAARAAKVGVSGPTTPAGTSSAPFTIAVMPDTQDETLNAANPKFANRTQWLVDNRDRLNLEYVMHSGDVVDWGWLVPSQFDVAKAAIRKLADAGIPYALSIGNHDTSAVGWNNVAGSTGYGGSAYAYNPECPSKLGASQCNSNLLVRRTDAFNAAFPLSSIRNVGGAYETGKVDNIWTSFTDAGSGTKWLVLTLELWPRAGVVSWAADVVSAHPDYNVLVQTHSYLTGGGNIEQSNGGYGSTSGQYLHDNLIAKYPNIKLVFSGHVGDAARRVDTGVNGNKIVSYLECFHSGSTNPVRLVTIDPASSTVTSTIYAPLTNETWTQYSTTDSINLVR